MTDSMDKGWHRITYPSILNHVYVIDDSCMQCLCHVVCIKAVRRSTCSATRHNPAMRLSQKADVAYLALRQAIMEQALTPGTKLPEDPLAEQFQISRTLVRAALARLASEGLIEMGNKRTATVAQPSLDEARAVFEVRRCLEAEVVRLVRQRWQAARRAPPEAHAGREPAGAAPGRASGSIRLAGEFPPLLGELSGNPLLTRYLSEVTTRCSLILAEYGRPHSSDCAANEYSPLTVALAKLHT